MRVLALSLYGGLAASTRHRLLHYRQAWSRAGIELSVEPLLDDVYLTAIFSEKPKPRAAVLRQIARRLVHVTRARRFDLVIVAHELLPWAPPWLERSLVARGTPYVLDIDDAMFHRYDQHRSAWVRRVYGEKLPQICAGASAVFAGSDYLVDWCRQWSSNVHFVPTQVDTRRYVPRPEGRATRPFTIGWMGSPSTARCLDVCESALARATADLGARVLVVGGGSHRVAARSVEYRPWTETREVSDIQEMSVGIMPLFDEPFMRGKCAFKLIQYMACGVPVVASPVGMNRRLVTEAGAGYLAESTEAWTDAFARLAREPAAADAMGLSGRRAVRAGYSLERLGPETARWLVEAYRLGRR